MEICRGDRAHQTPKGIACQADGDNKQDCWARWLACYFIEGATAVGGSGRSTVQGNIGCEVGDEEVKNRSHPEPGACKDSEPWAALNSPASVQREQQGSLPDVL